jgi:hypothetical protein
MQSRRSSMPCSYRDFESANDMQLRCGMNCNTLEASLLVCAVLKGVEYIEHDYRKGDSAR